MPCCLVNLILILSSRQTANTIAAFPNEVEKVFGYTYFSGVRYLFVAIVANIALFIEREWVVRDEGYLKMLHKNR